MYSFKVKENFFDSDKVKASVGAATLETLSHMGALVRKIAKNSIRRSKYAAAPGKPPRSHTGLLDRFIYYAMDPLMQSVVIGAELISGPIPTDAPHNLEYGGMMARPVPNRRRRVRSIGGSGEIRMRPENLTYRNARAKGVRGQVHYAKIRTAAQAARANRLNEQLYGPENIQVEISAHPFMGPALEAAINKLADSLQVI